MLVQPDSDIAPLTTVSEEIREDNSKPSTNPTADEAITNLGMDITFELVNDNYNILVYF